MLHASPRDAVELHAAAIAVKERLVSTDDIGEYLECGRQAVFELISQLAAHYRTYQIAGTTTQRRGVPDFVPVVIEAMERRARS